MAVTENGTAPVDRWLLGAERITDPRAEPATWDAVPHEARSTVREAIALGADRPETASLDDPEYLAVVRGFDATQRGLAPDPDPASLATNAMGTYRLFARRQTVTETVYSYRLRPVGESAAAVVDCHALHLSEADLSPGERELIEAAIETGSYTEGFTNHGADPMSGAFLSVVDRIETTAGEEASIAHGVVAYVRYRGTLYRATLEYDSAE